MMLWKRLKHEQICYKQLSSVHLSVDVQQEKTHQNLLAGVEAGAKLRHADTKEKSVLPSADGKLYLIS